MNVDRLDDLPHIHTLDTLGMLRHVGALAPAARDAWALAGGLVLPAGHRAARQVALVGTGPAALAGDLVAAALAGRGRAPLLRVGPRRLPAWVDESTLVVALSHGAGRAEAPPALHQARDRGCPLVVVAAHGRPARLADHWSIPLLRLGYPAPPPVMAGTLWIALLGLLRAAGLAPDLSAEVDEGLALVEAQAAAVAPQVPRRDNLAKQLAAGLAGAVPVVIGAGPLAAAARWWKFRIDGLGRGWALTEPLATPDHVPPAGASLPLPAADLLRFVILQAGDLDPRPLSPDHGGRYLTVPLPGRSPLARLLSAVHLGDTMSSYLALLHGR